MFGGLPNDSFKPTRLRSLKPTGRLQDSMTFISPKKLDRSIDKSVIELMAPRGFTKATGGGIERWHGDRYDYIGCVVNKTGGTIGVTPFGQMGFGHIKKIYSHFMFDDAATANRIAVHVQLKYAHLVRDWNARMLCGHVERQEDFLRELLNFVESQLYPALMAYVSPENVLEAYLRKDENDPRSFDPPSWFGASSALNGLIYARLHGPTSYSSLRRRYSDHLRDLPEGMSERSTKLLTYLDLADPLPQIEASPSAV